jgi:hypothetical protein
MNKFRLFDQLTTNLQSLPATVSNLWVQGGLLILLVSLQRVQRSAQNWGDRGCCKWESCRSKPETMDHVNLQSVAVGIVNRPLSGKVHRSFVSFVGSTQVVFQVDYF